MFQKCENGYCTNFKSCKKLFNHVSSLYSRVLTALHTRNEKKSNLAK